MASEKVETIVAGNYAEMEREEADPSSAKSRLSKLFWHGGSVYDAWFSCASNQALINYNNLNYIYIYLDSSTLTRTAVLPTHLPLFFQEYLKFYSF